MNILTPSVRLATLAASAPLLVDNVNAEGFHGIAVLTTAGGAANVEGFQGLALLNGRLGTNHLKNSQVFDLEADPGAAGKWWQVGMTYVANTATAPDGTTTAYELKTAAGASHYCYQRFSAGQRAYCFSAYLKQPASNRRQYVSLYASDGVSVNKFLCIDTDTWLTSASSAGITDITITSVGSGWYRVSFSYLYVGTYANANMGIDPTNSAGSVTFAAPTPAEGFLVWGAQINVGLTPTVYCPTTSTALPT